MRGCGQTVDPAMPHGQINPNFKGVGLQTEAAHRNREMA